MQPSVAVEVVPFPNLIDLLSTSELYLALEEGKQTAGPNQIIRKLQSSRRELERTSREPITRQRDRVFSHWSKIC